MAHSYGCDRPGAPRCWSFCIPASRITDGGMRALLCRLAPSTAGVVHRVDGAVLEAGTLAWRAACASHGTALSHGATAPFLWHRTLGSTASSSRQTKRHTGAAEMGMYWGAASIAMIGLAYASVPLYRVFCAATGYGGAVAGAATVEEKLRRRQESPNLELEKAAMQRELTVWFNADVADNMPWSFTPTQESVRVRAGQSTLAFFTARNNSDKPVTGYSIYNVTPEKAAQYFNKIQCFCFEEQRLRAGEEVDMPVFFYIDPELVADWNCRNVSNITLSYVFHKVDDEDLEEGDDDTSGPSLVKLHGPGTDTSSPAAAASSWKAMVDNATAVQSSTEAAVVKAQ
ncbi:cytochrome c oxidase assembly protein CtaG/Cox11-domain-containing protein [Haematococcus lacustris]